MKHSQRAIAIGPLALHLAIPLSVGGAAALLTRQSFEAYAAMPKPPLSPPGWVFPVVWTGLYALMGVSTYRLWKKEDMAKDADAQKKEEPSKKIIFMLYGAQLAFNFMWPLWFFQWKQYCIALLWLAGLLVLAALWAYLARRADKAAGYLQTPYLVWLLFALYLNFAKCFWV